MTLDRRSFFKKFSLGGHKSKFIGSKFYRLPEILILIEKKSLLLSSVFSGKTKAGMGGDIRTYFFQNSP